MGGLIKKVTLEQRLKGGKGVGPPIIWGKNLPARDNNQCKGPEEDHLEGSRSSKEASVAGAEGGRN